MCVRERDSSTALMPSSLLCFDFFGLKSPQLERVVAGQPKPNQGKQANNTTANATAQGSVCEEQLSFFLEGDIFSVLLRN